MKERIKIGGNHAAIWRNKPRQRTSYHLSVDQNWKSTWVKVRQSRRYYSAPANLLSDAELLEGHDTCTSDGKHLLRIMTAEVLGGKMLVELQLVQHRNHELVDSYGVNLTFRTHVYGPASTLLLRLARYQITEKQYLEKLTTRESGR